MKRRRSQRSSIWSWAARFWSSWGSGRRPVASANPWQTGYRMMALEVADMDRALDYLAGKGVAVTWGPVTLGSSKRAEIQDPDGLSIELRQW